GIRANSTSASGYSSTDIALVVDGSTLTSGFYRRVQCVNNTNVVTGNTAGASCGWSISGMIALSAGTHTIEVDAVFTGGLNGSTSANVSGNSTTDRQGELTVVLLKQ